MKKRITVLLTTIFALVITARAQSPTVTFTATPSTVCAGSTINFSNTSTGNPTSWTWSFPGGTPATYSTTVSPGNPPAILYNIPGIYNVTCIVSNGSGSDTDFVANDVQINAPPTAKIYPPSGGVCDTTGGAQDTVYFSVTSAAGNTFSWAPSTTLSCSTCARTNAYPTVTTVYTLTVTGTNQCSAAIYDTINVLNSIAKITGKDSICAGYPDTLTASGGASNPSSGTKYTWSNGQTGAQIIVSPSALTTYSVLLTGFGGAACTSQAFFTVHPSPVPKFTISGVDSICNPPGKTTLTVSPAGNIYKYYWYGPNGVKDTNVFTTSPTVTTTYTLVVKNIGCYYDTLVKVKVNNPPVVVFTGATNLCQGSTTTVCATGGTQYHWSTGGTTSCINVSPPVSITYTVKVISGACSKDTTFTINIDTIPNVKFKGDTSICKGDSTTIYVSGGYTYLWNTGSTADSVFMKNATQGQTFFVTVTRGACSKDSQQITVKVYPHPKPAIYPIDTTVCQYDSVQLTAAGGNYYIWTPKKSGLNHYLGFGDTDRNNAAPAHYGTSKYNVNICTWGCCKDTSLAINVIPGVAGYSVCCNETVPGGTVVNLTATYDPGPFAVESWSPTTGLSCATCPDPTATVYNTTTYVATFLDQATGCPVKDSVTIDIANCNVFVPNVFSPNGDGIDDYLYVRSLCLKKIDFAVFDRWGNKVFETQSQNTPWDGTYRGKPMEIGTYMWYLTGLLNDGTNISKSGNVTIVR